MVLQLLLACTLVLSGVWRHLSPALSPSSSSPAVVSVAAFTLLTAVFHVSSSREHLATAELVLLDSLALALWCAVLGLAARTRRTQWGSLAAQGALCVVLVAKLFVALHARPARTADEEAQTHVVVVVKAPVEAEAEAEAKVGAGGEGVEEGGHGGKGR